MVIRKQFAAGRGVAASHTQHGRAENALTFRDTAENLDDAGLGIP